MSSNACERIHEFVFLRIVGPLENKAVGIGDRKIEKKVEFKHREERKEECKEEYKEEYKEQC